MFELLKIWFTFFELNENFIFANNFDQKCYYFWKILDETFVEIDEFNKDLYISYTIESFSINYNFDFFEIYFDIVNFYNKI